VENGASGPSAGVVVLELPVVVGNGGTIEDDGTTEVVELRLSIEDDGMTEVVKLRLSIEDVGTTEVVILRMSIEDDGTTDVVELRLSIGDDKTIELVILSIWLSIEEDEPHDPFPLLMYAVDTAVIVAIDRSVTVDPGISLVKNEVTVCASPMTVGPMIEDI